MDSAFKSIRKPFNHKLDIGGKPYLYFAGTAYLGIPQNQEFIQLYIDGIKKFGLNNGTSRNNNIQLGIYDDAEKIAAERFKAEDALITSSGYLAAQLTVKALSHLGKTVYAPATHPALWLDQQEDNDKPFLEWAKETVERINQSTEEKWVLISNSMNNLFPEVYDFSFLNQICSDKKIILIVDDSHGIGVSHNGLGSFASLPKKSITCVVVASMAKAIGVDAGLVLGPKEIIEQLKNTETFVGASPPTAAGLYAFIHAETIYLNAWHRLQENIAQFSSKLNLKWKFEVDLPIFQINDSALAQTLLSHQILISSFPYPNKNSDPINRVVLNSWHENEDIEQLILAIRH